MTSSSYLEIDQELAPLIAPIHKSEPCGVNVSVEKEFMELRDLATAPVRSGPGPRDWVQIEAQALDILKSQSKDLRVAAFLAASYLQKDLLAGFIRGTRLLCALVQEYPEKLYPLARGSSYLGQANALRWFLKHANYLLKSATPEALDASLFDAAFTCARELSDLAEHRFPRAKDRVKDLRDALEIQRARIAASVEGPSERSMSGPKSGVAQQSVGEHQITKSAPAPTTGDLWQDLRARAHAMREENPCDPQAYRLLRQALWLQLDEAPMESHPGVCQVPMPTAAEMTRLEDHRDQKRWLGLLHEAETMVGRYVFGLDLHRLSAEALSNLDGGERAQNAILTELSALTQRMPSLVELKGANGQKFASVLTKDWLADFVKKTHQPSEFTQVELRLEEEAWWLAIAAVEEKDRKTKLEHLQRALLQSPDVLTYAKRALFTARSLGQVPGLRLLMACLAEDALSIPGGRVVSERLAQECRQTLLDAQMQSAEWRVPALGSERVRVLAMGMAKTDIVTALQYFQPQTGDC